MNKDIMDMLDERFILEAEPEEKIGHKKKKAHFPVAAAVAACIGLTAVTGGGAAALVYFSTGTSTSEVYDSRTEQVLENKGLVINETAVGKHLEVTADTVLVDDYTYKVFFTAKPVDEAGRKYIEECRNSSYPDLQVVMENSKGENVIVGSEMARVVGDDLIMILEGIRDKNFKEAMADNAATFRFSSGSPELNEGLRDVSIKVSLAQNLTGKYVTAEDGTRIYASPIEFAFISDTYGDHVRCTYFTWKEGGRERFLEGIGVTQEQYEKEYSNNKWAEWEYLLKGKFINRKGNAGVGGDGEGFWTEGGIVTEDGEVIGKGEYVVTAHFGCVVDFEDVTGIVYGLEKLSF